MKFLKIFCLFVAGLLFFIPESCFSAEKNILAIVHENDIFSQRDQYYTSGMRINWFTPRTNIPGFMEKFTRKLDIYRADAHHRMTYSVGQNMYTPLDITDPDPPSDDRPYAGWFYSSVGFLQDRGSRLDSLEITLGVVGPSSRAKQTQKQVHRLVGADNPEAWKTQLEDEIGVRFTYGHRNVAWTQTGFAGRTFDISPGYSISLGNVFTAAELTTMLRWGMLSKRDYGPPLIRSGTPGAGFFIPAREFEWYFYLYLAGRYVARDIFLDGNTIRDSRSVDKEPWLGEAQLGIVLTWESFRISYTHVFPTKEFETQRKADDYGAITLSFRF